VKLTLIATVLWAAGFILNAALFFVLVFKRRYRIVPWFTAWMGFQCVYTITLFVEYRLGSKHLYAVLYWSGALLDFLLQIAVVLEIARSVLKRSYGWVEGARARLIGAGIMAPLVAFGMAWAMTPAARTRLEAWDARASLFTTILICLMFTAVTVSSSQLGVAWRSHIMRESYGLVLWTLVAFVTDTLHAYWRTLGHFLLLENVRIVFFQAALIYWAIAFWRPEAAPAVMPENAMLELDRLVSRLEYPKSNIEPPTTGVPPK
jgi:hypothetical protein